MDTPQLENGYLKIANQIVEHLCKYRLSGVENQILWVIFRKTYGFNKKEDNIALSQFVELTGLSQPHVHRAILGLKKRRVILVKKNIHTGNLYHINKHLWEWEVSPKKGIPNNGESGIPNNGILVSPIMGNTKDIINTRLKDKGQSINSLIELFKEVNPMYKDFFKNTTERKALEDLIEQITYDKLEATIRKLPDLIKRPYAPKITKPTELRRDLGKLIAFSKQEGSKFNRNKIAII